MPKKKRAKGKKQKSAAVQQAQKPPAVRRDHISPAVQQLVKLPPPLLRTVLSRFLTARQVILLARTCRFYRKEVLESDSVWESHYRHDFAQRYVQAQEQLVRAAADCFVVLADLCLLVRPSGSSRCRGCASRWRSGTPCTRSGRRSGRARR